MCFISKFWHSWLFKDIFDMAQNENVFDTIGLRDRVKQLSVVSISTNMQKTKCKYGREGTLSRDIV